MLRDAVHADLPAILDIYNVSIGTTTTWSDRPQTHPEREAWFERRQAAGDGVVVAVDDGAVVGFARVGTLPEIGWKFGRWLDLVLLQRIISTGTPRN